MNFILTNPVAYAVTFSLTMSFAIVACYIMGTPGEPTRAAALTMLKTERAVTWLLMRTCVTRWHRLRDLLYAVHDRVDVRQYCRLSAALDWACYRCFAEEADKYHGFPRAVPDLSEAVPALSEWEQAALDAGLPKPVEFPLYDVEEEGL